MPAKASKPYAKAQQNSFARHKVLSGLGTIIVVAIIATAASGGGDLDNAANSTTGGTTGSSTGGSTGPKPRGGNNDQPSAKFPKQDGNWRLESVQVESSRGDFGGRARITYTGDEQGGGDNVFTITIFKNGDEVSVLKGSASDVKWGGTVNVTLISSDAYVVGPYTFDFQYDL